MSKLKENHPKLKLHKYVGLLEFYFETGMEQMGIIFHDDRGNHEAPKWDKPEETMIYRSLSWSIWFGNKLGKYNIIIFDKENNIVYQGPLTKDKRKIVANKYKYSFLPKEIDKKDWLHYVQNEYRAELYTNELTDAIKKEYRLDFDIAEMVHDDLTGKDAVICNVTLGKDKTVGYWVNGDYLDGGRHPWEITKIDWMKRMKEEMESGNKKD
jgi:hypothetical protein